jgi:two-component system NtrC family response regulator
MLVEHFLAEASAECGARTVTPAAMERLCGYHWPGNVRELRNCIRRAAALADGCIDDGVLDLEPAAGARPTCELRLASRAADAPIDLAAKGFLTARHATDDDLLGLSGKTFEQMQAAIFCWALRRSHGSRRQAAQTLGISRSTFCDRIRKLGLSQEHDSTGGRP